MKVLEKLKLHPQPSPTSPINVGKNQKKTMDTDDLSIPTYKGIILEAENFNHDLTLQFGVLASSCKDDDDYLNQVEALINKWLQVDDFDDIIDYIFFRQPVNQQAFAETLRKILSHIEVIRNTPMIQREYEDWG